MPKWMDKPEEKDWNRATKAVKRTKKKPKSKFKDQDYGLAMHIWKNIQKSKKKKKKAAFLINIVKLANYFDDSGLPEVADELDSWLDLYQQGVSDV